MPNDQMGIVNQIIEIADYRPHPKNYNRHPVEQVRMIEVSLKNFGQPESVTVWAHPHQHQRKTYRGYFIAGHGVRDGALKARWTQLRADILPADYDETKALAYIAAANKIATYSDPDQVALAQLLDEVKANDLDTFIATAYDEKELDHLMESLAKDSLKSEKMIQKLQQDLAEEGYAASHKPPEEEAEQWLNVQLKEDGHPPSPMQSPPKPKPVIGDIDDLDERVLNGMQQLSRQRTALRQCILMYSESVHAEYENLCAGIKAVTGARDDAEAVLMALRSFYTQCREPDELEAVVRSMEPLEVVDA